MDYSATKLSESDIQKQGYRQYLGGGQKHWQTRGAFHECHHQWWHYRRDVIFQRF
jgi:hypothetical protein